MTPAAFVRGCAWHLGLIVAVLLGVAFYLGYAVAQADQPDDRVVTPEGMCAEEDSCAVEYEGGRWVITPDIP